MKIEKASKKKTKLRLAMFGPAGYGKTFTALLMAKGMLSSNLVPEDSRFVVIDTEHRSAEKYAGVVPYGKSGATVEFDFDHLHMDKPTVDNFIAALDLCKDYPVVITDSGSHIWRELLGEIDRLARDKYHGNTHSAWSEGTPKQKKLINALLALPGHLIFTMRSKTEWTIDNSSGKSKPVRVGLAPEQGKGIEYEFDMLIELSSDHNGHVLKDRTGKFQDRIIEKPGESFGLEVIEWLNEGKEPSDPWMDMINEKQLGQRAQAALLLYLNSIQTRAQEGGTALSHADIKAQAVQRPDDFWKGFEDYLTKYDKPAEEAPKEKAYTGQTDHTEDGIDPPAGDPLPDDEKAAAQEDAAATQSEEYSF